MLRCILCRDGVRQLGGYYCPPCKRHQDRAAAVARRVNRGRKVASLSVTEMRGVGVSKPAKN